MRTITATTAACLLLSASAVSAQNLTGDWQGALKAGTQELRLILHLEPGEAGTWKATLASIDQGPDRGTALPASAVTVQRSAITLAFPAIRGTFTGTIGPDGNSIAGTWTQGQPLPLELRRATPETAWKDPSPHAVQFVTVSPGVRLEVLDWGGPANGPARTLVLLAGMGNTAHVFDKFAPKLTGQYRVVGMTRRGFGASSAPDTGYAADQLGDDVLSVLDVLRVSKPVLVGHSLGGEELSSVGSRHPERISGLIYLDAGYGYAFYDQSRGDLDLDLPELERKLALLHMAARPADPTALIKELLETTLPAFERNLRELQKTVEATPPALRAAQASGMSPVAAAIFRGMQKYTTISAPILAIFAIPHEMPPMPGVDPTARAAQESRANETSEAQVKAFERGLPSARVVRIPHANHYVFLSHEADVLREMQAFINDLK